MQRLPSIADTVPTAAIGSKADARFQPEEVANLAKIVDFHATVTHQWVTSTWKSTDGYVREQIVGCSGQRVGSEKRRLSTTVRHRDRLPSCSIVQRCRQPIIHSRMLSAGMGRAMK